MEFDLKHFGPPKGQVVKAGYDTYIGEGPDPKNYDFSMRDRPLPYKDIQLHSIRIQIPIPKDDTGTMGYIEERVGPLFGKITKLLSEDGSENLIFLNVKNDNKYKPISYFHFHATVLSDRRVFDVMGLESIEDLQILRNDLAAALQWPILQPSVRAQYTNGVEIADEFKCLLL